MTLAEELKVDILNDPYFLSLFIKAERVMAYQLFDIELGKKITEQEYKDLMQYADILSHSVDPEARNKAYKIISLLVKGFGETKSFKLYAAAILSKLGNFPALKFLNHTFRGNDNLPLEREIERNFKQEVQKTSNGKSTFTDAQYEVRKRLDKFDYFSFSGPTSIGKSFILKDYIRNLLQKEELNGESIVILVPTRALISQVVNELREEIDDHEVNIASHPILSLYATRKYKQHIFIFTPERLLSYVSNNMLGIKYLFVDEAQKIVAPNDSRSSLYYHAIYETIRKFATKIIFASPNIPNPDIFLRLFEKDPTGFLAVSEQTVAQNRYFVDFEEKRLSFFSDLGNEEEIGIIPSSYSPNSLIESIGKKVNNLIYCNGIAETVRRAKDFSSTLEEVSINVELSNLIGFIAGYVHKDYYLIECLKKGVAFHHGRMPQKVRRKIEDFFADKNSSLRYVFCTSTLLEGVNLPAKNIFVFNDGHGLQTFEKIDFENLIGRAGRLTKEFSGDVICVKDDSRRWKKRVDLVKKAELDSVDSFLINKDTRKKKEFLNIAKALENKELSKGLRVGEKENLTHYASIVLLHHIENESSVLKTSFLEKNKEAYDLLKKSQANNRVPSDILKISSTIKPKHQNSVLEHLEKNKEKAILNIDTEDKESIFHALEVLYNLYDWEEESKGRDPLIPPGLIKKGYGRSRLKYWAMLLRHWVRSEPLNRLIGFSIKYHSDRGEIWFYENGQPQNEPFSGNQRQINIIIEQMMSDIENGLRFKIEKYFLNYYLLSKNVLGENNAGQDWSELIEYGTTNRRAIEVQNIGFSRGASNYLLHFYYEFFIFNEDGKLLGIKEKKLLDALDKNNEYYDELEELLK